MDWMQRACIVLFPPIISPHVHSMIKFIFDLDGTLTMEETLPLMAQHFGLTKDIAKITQQTIQGLIPFEKSLQNRLSILGSLPVDEVAHLLANVPLYAKIHNFILQNPEQCLIATGNLDVWLAKLTPRLGCKVHSSTASVANNAIASLLSTLNKKALVQQWQAQGYVVVFMGDGDNDVQAMLCADVAIATSMTHAIAPHVQAAATYVVTTEEAAHALLCQLLTQYSQPKENTPC